jgi:hypothetical protein
MNVLVWSCRAVLLAACLVAPVLASAEDDTYVGSSFGKLRVTMKDDGGLVGSFDKGGKLVTALTKDHNGWEGVWTADEAPKECDSEKNGSSYWGNIFLTVAEGGRVLTGKWGYCDTEPDTDFQAKWDGK